ncbi:DNA helicase RecD, partial [Streptomyces sp. SID2119]|nr:DNA helicase RecD [Streptomyces sp. SID2119]
MTALPGETPGTVGTDTPQGAEPPAATDVEGPAHAEAPEAEAEAEAEVAGETGDAAGDGPAGEAPAAAALSEAQAELAAQRELREKIAKRKAEKEGPVAAGTKLSGPAADLLAAVRAVESGEKAGTEFFDSPA